MDAQGLQELRDQINKLGVDMTAIMTRAREEQRELTSDEEQSFDRMDADRERLLASEARMVKVATIGEPTGRRVEHVQPAGHRQAAAEGRQKLSNEERADAMQAWLLAGSDEERTQARRDAAQKAGISLDQKQFRIRLAQRAPKSLRAEDMKTWEERDLTATFISPDSGGYNTVPDEAMRGLESALLAFGGMRSVASVLRTGTGANLPIPTTNDTSNEGAILGEAAEVTTLDPVFSQLVLEAYKYTSKMILVSVEFLQDSSLNVADTIGRLLGERIARITNRHFTVGDGNGKPKGVVEAATSSGVTTASSTAITYDELVDLIHSVDPAYRNNGASFMFHDNTLKALKKIKVPQFSGDTQGQPLWRPGMAVGVPDTIDSYAYTINQHMPVPTSAKKAVLFGQLSKYQIRDVRDVTLLRLDERYAEFHQVAFLAFSRHDGDLLDAGTNPVKYLTMKS